MRLLYPAPALNRSPHSPSVSNGRLKAFAFGLALCGLGALPAHAQLNYAPGGFTPVVGTYTDLGTNGSQILMQNAPSGSVDLDDDGLSDPENIGFTFSYNGQSFTQFVMSTNGFIKLGSVLPSSEFLGGSVGGTSIVGDALASTNPLDINLLAPFNHDLTPGSGGVNEYRVFTSGTVGSRVCTIQWKDMADFPSVNGATNLGTAWQSVNFQVKLYETTNRVEYVYSNAALYTSNFVKTAGVGLKGSNNSSGQIIYLQKGYNSPFTTPGVYATPYTPGVTFPATAGVKCFQGPVGGFGGGSSPSQSLNFARTLSPVSGSTYRFDPTPPITDNASVIVYTLAKLAIPDAVPHVIRARVTNTTGATIAGRNVTLNVTGANAFSDTKPTGSIPSGGSVVVSFAGFTPTNTGTNTVTVTLPSDDVAGDNTSSISQIIGTSELSYASTAPNVGGVGFNGAFGQFVARFKAVNPRSVDAISVDFQATGSTQNYRLIIVDDDGAGGTPGTILYTSPSLTRTAAAQTAIYTVAPAVPVSGDFFVGVYQTGTTNIGFSYESEDPIRNNSFYYRGTAGATFPAWNDFATANSPFRFAVGLGFAPTTPPVTPPNCAQLQIPAANATNVDRTGALQWGSGGGSPTGFDVYLSTNQTAVQTESAGAQVASNQPATTYNYSNLLPLTVYYYKIVARNAAGAATGCATRSFTTGPGAPANDDCAAATPLTLRGAGVIDWDNSTTSGPTTSGTTSGASEAAGSTDPTCSQGDIKDVWYSFTTTNTDGIYIYLESQGATALGAAVYSACGGTSLDCFSYTGFTPGDAVAETFALARNTTYRLRVFTNNGLGALGAFKVSVGLPANITFPGGTSTAPIFNTLIVGSGATITQTADINANLVIVQDGGTLNMGSFLVNAYQMNVNAGGTLGIGNPQGIAATGGTTGNVRGDGPRNFSNDATYNYTYFLAQSTGTGLPSTVRSLGSGVGQLTLTNPVSVRRRVVLSSGNLKANNSVGRLTLLSDANNTAMVVNGGAGTVLGQVRVQRWIDGSINPGRGYRHFASPVVGAPISDLTTPTFTPRVNPDYNDQALRPGLTYYTFPNTFRYVESQVNATRGIDFNEGWFSPAATSEVMTAGRGYTVSINAGNKPDVVGTLNNGNVPISGISNTAGNAVESGWNLIGNPYPAPMDWDQVSAVSITNGGIDNQIAIFKSEGLNSGHYDHYTNGVGPVGPEIPMGQAFFVHRSTAGTGTFTLSNASRVTTYANPAFQRRAETRPLVQVSLKRTGQTAEKDQTYVYFEQGATAGNDRKYDALKLPSVGTTPSLFTRAGNREMAINGLPEMGNADVLVPLAAEVSVTGQYVLNAEQILNMAAGMEVVLEDALTGTTQNLRQNPQYVFTATAGNTTPRFTLHFRTGSVTSVANDVLAQQLSVFPNPVSGHALRVQLGGLINGERTVMTRLVNALGQVVLERQIDVANGAANAELDVRTLANGVYTLQVVAGENTATRTVVVQ